MRALILRHDHLYANVLVVWEKATGGNKNLFGWLAEHAEELTGSSNHMAALSIERVKWTSIYPIKER